MSTEEALKFLDFAIEATSTQTDYDIGLRNGMRFAKSLLDEKEPHYDRLDIIVKETK